MIEVLNVGFKVYFSQAFGAPAPSSGVSVQLTNLGQANRKAQEDSTGTTSSKLVIRIF